MCVTAIVIASVAAVASAGVGAYTSIQSANANANAARYKYAMETKAAYEQREMARIEAAQAEIGRTEEFEQARSAALAAIGASGLGEHISFFQAIDPKAQSAFLRDVRSIRLNLTQKETSIADQVQVAGFEKDINLFNTKLTKIGAIADFITTSMQAASFYAMNSTPASAGAPAGGAPPPSGGGTNQYIGSGNPGWPF